MTRKDYIRLAAALLQSRPAPLTVPAGAYAGWRMAAEAVAAYMDHDPCFDKARFLKNAGVIT